MPYDLEAVRSRFPALAVTDGGRPRIYLDNPAGTQVPECVAERMTECLLHANANLGGFFETSRRAGQIVEDAHRAMADLLNAASADEIVFGQNMTSLTLHVSRSIGRHLRRGDRIVLSRMDHDANVTPWTLLARDLGLEVGWLPFNTETFEFDLDLLDGLLGERTRLVCVAGASNLTGTINDVRTISRKAREAGAWTYIDAVQSVPHVSTDVQAIGCDFLVCSAYKHFGPHIGGLWGRREILEGLEPYKVRPAPDEIPGAYETGTLSHEAMAGATAAVDYLAWIGETMAEDFLERNERFEPGRRRFLHAAMDCLFDYESTLMRRLVEGLTALPGIEVQGVTSPEALSRRLPTVSFTARGAAPAAIARSLAERG
ncbi:MAG TPA: cysteine desulfurase-like protein, partial [Woeseiaceae bacterium]|nr:cysteine desulfurase-like protein [Woeseiaceae bacterium]